MKYIFFVFLFFFLAEAIPAQDREQLKEEIDKIIYFDTQITHDKIPGYLLALIVGDSVFYYGYGSLSANDTHPPDKHTLFEVGSVTKLFTASLVGLLADEGLVHYDSSLNHYLPAAYRNPKLSHINIGSLLTHTSGLPKKPSGFGIYEKETDNPYAHYSKELLLDFYKNFDPHSILGTPIKKKRKFLKKNKPQVNYQYSHLNYALLEVAIEAVSGKSYQSLLYEKLFQPLGMKDSYIELAKADSIPLATGYNRAGTEAKAWDFASFAASQGMKSTAEDLVIFLQAHMETPSDSLHLSLYNNTLPAISTGLTSNAAMGYGWHILHQKKYYDIRLHAGSTGGHRAFVGFVRETKTGVVVLSNSENSTGGLGYLLLRLINFNWKKKLPR